MKIKKDLTSVRIKTDRLILLPIDYLHAEEIFTNFDTGITQYMFPKPAENIGGTNAFIKTALEELANGTTLQLQILVDNTNEFIGCAGLHRIDSQNPELGIWIKKTSHGNGYGIEAITGMIIWARENLEFDYLAYPVDKRNYPSRRIPEKNGGILGREFKKINQAGFELDMIEYWIYKYHLFD
ncbi:MAG: GNAT family N-acetyltransferase [Fibrobacterota bacterium]|nr:GNAT family N-acetyltransferase [Chitinispirillaceae bacterium]